MRVAQVFQIDSLSVINKMSGANCIISLGANAASSWGDPTATFCHSLRILDHKAICTITCSRIYRTQPHSGAGLMPDFYNCAVLAQTNLSVGGLLRVVKTIERDAGRKSRPRWSARPLDIDIIDYGGRVLNWPAANRMGGPLVLPHPFAHQRGFVLVPLAEIAPGWRHPALGITAGDLLRRSPSLRRGIRPA